MPIPIQNIYYLLCYAWDKLDESDIVEVDKINSTELIDLFAKVLSTSCSRLLKQGMDRYYVEHEDVISGIKGKLNFSETIKQNVLPLRKTVCIHDEFDYDILHNQIIKATIKKLLRTKGLDSSIKNNLHKIYLKLPPVSDIIIKESMFSRIRLHRNNYHYDFILKVCRIINENLFIDEANGFFKFMDFTRDEKKMASLFEKFVRNFYKIETDFSSKRTNIKWSFDFENEEDKKLLPNMQTDITLQGLNKKIIIDTKYYKEAFQYHYDTKKLNSSNLYQLFAYMKNQEDGSALTQNCEGILLYPSVEKDFAFSYKYENHRIRLMSINLDQKWQDIRHDLLRIVVEPV